MARTPKFYHHGRSPAAWAGSVTAAIGFILGAIGAVAGPNWVVVGIGVALVLIAGVGTMVLKAMGFGQPASGR